MNFEKILNCIKSGYICDIGMAADMIWVIIKNNDNGKHYSIDIQSPFRIILNNDILVGNMDMYVNREIFDKKMKKCKRFFPCKITEICIKKHNDICIFSEKITIETFTNSSFEDDEQWRVFERHNTSNPHYVAYPDVISEE